MTRQLEEKIPAFMEEASVPGLSMTLICDRTPFWDQSFGVESMETGEPVGRDTVFEAASLSKPVLAYRALRLYEKDILDLDAPLDDYLPEPYIPDEARLKLITARHALSHTTGFPNWRREGTPLRIMLPPGKRFSYSGEGYIYLQKAMERVTGEPALEYIASVLEPFEMASSRFTWTGEENGPLATGHDERGEPVEKKTWPEMRSSSSLHTTPTDYARFMCAVMKPSDSEHHLTPETTREMLTPQVQVNDNAPWHKDWPRPGVDTDDLVSWGLGWGLQQIPQGFSFWHWGDNNHYHAIAMGFPEKGQGIVIMTNGANGQKLIRRIMREAIGGSYPGISWLERVYNPG